MQDGGGPMLRKLKVCRKYVERRTPYRTRYVPVSSVALQGKWLEEAGFEAGARVNVRVGYGRLVIEKEVAQ